MSSLLILMLVVMVVLTISALSDPSDESCLSNLRSGLEDPRKALVNWTGPNFASPCNGFTSFLEGATCNNGRIYKLSLTKLSLSGSISPFLSNCTNLQSLDLSSNSLSGPIPPQLSSLLNLAILNLSSNALSGQIPPQLALCAYLNVIDLHSNALTGQIPDQLGLLVRLAVFDVSYNDLEGPIPPVLANKTMYVPRFNATSFVGNKGLYGFPLPPMRRAGLSVVAIVGIGLGSGLLSLLISFTAVCVWLRVTERNEEVRNGGGGGEHQEGKMSHFMPDY